MAQGEIHVGDVSSRFIVTLKDGDGIRDISSATVLQIIFHKPDGTDATKTASFYTDGTDGVLTWATTSTSDLDQEGLWKLQAYVEFSGGGKYHSDIRQFQVYPNL